MGVGRSSRFQQLRLPPPVQNVAPPTATARNDSEACFPCSTDPRSAALFFCAFLCGSLGIFGDIGLHPSKSALQVGRHNDVRYCFGNVGLSHLSLLTLVICSFLVLET